jgi:hypothetical protein
MAWNTSTWETVLMETALLQGFALHRFKISVAAAHSLYCVKTKAHKFYSRSTALVLQHYCRAFSTSLQS